MICFFVAMSRDTRDSFDQLKGRPGLNHEAEMKPGRQSISARVVVAPYR
jgi:hypothetical protein